MYIPNILYDKYFVIKGAIAEAVWLSMLPQACMLLFKDGNRKREKEYEWKNHGRTVFTFFLLLSMSSQ